MKLKFENGVFVMDEYAAGFFHDPIENNYKTKSIRAAWRLRDSFDVKLKGLIKLFTLRTLALNARRLVYPDHFKLKPHQSEAVAFLLSRNHSYIAYRMRLGKTVIGIVAMNTLKVRTLLVVPPSLVPVWQRELLQWGLEEMVGGGWGVQVLTGKTTKTHKGFPVVICPHSLLERPEILKMLKAQEFGLCLVDEAHRFKNPEALRTKALFGDGIAKPGLVHSCKRVSLFSGTPMLNRPMEMFAAIQALAHNLISFRTYVEFGMRYCAGKTLYIKSRGYEPKKVYDFRGASNILELRAQLEKFMLIKMDSDEKENVEQVVIPLRFQIPKPLAQAEAELKKQYSFDEIMEGATVGKVAEYRKRMGRSKVEKAAELINDELVFTADSVLVLAWHSEVINLLSIELRNWQPLVVQGGVSAFNREAYQDKFQTKKNRVIIAQISTMEGFDFSAANQVFFVEYDWTPGRNEQARFRVMKLGKKDLVTIKYLVAEDTLDEYILSSQSKKKSHINQFTKGET